MERRELSRALTLRNPIPVCSLAAIVVLLCAHSALAEFQPAAVTTKDVVVTDLRLEPGMPVFGIVVGDEPRAYALADLQTAGVAVHDVVSGRPIDVGFESADVRVLGSPDDVREHRLTSWSDWIGVHPDTSLWRIPAVAEPKPSRPAGDVRVKESRHYRTGFGCAIMPRMTGDGPKPPGLFVISGTIENVARDSVHHVVLRYELMDASGRVIYRDEGFNRSAEALAGPRLVHSDAVVPIDSGATDSFRMIFLADELPAFEDSRVTVSRVY